MKRLVLLILVAFVAVGGGVGCAKKKGGDANVPVPEGDRGGDPDSSGGGGGDNGNLDDNETSLSASKALLADFFFQQPVNNPTNKRFAMSLGEDGNGGYAGEVRIAFDDGGASREAVLSTSHPHYTGVSDSSNNVWFNYNGQMVWHGLFQDRFGAVVVVIDSSIDQGDGQASELVGGSVWYQNFTSAIPPQGPMQMCWNLRAGPYDCRTFIVNGYVSTTSSLYPNNYAPENSTTPYRGPYKKLGSFSGLIRSAVFGE